MTTIPEDLADIIADIVRNQSEERRRSRNRKRTGVITEVDAKKGKARVKLKEASGEQEEYITGWLRWKEAAAGEAKTHFPPSVDQQVDVVSESGELTDAVIELSTYSDQIERPSDKEDEYIVLNVGEADIRVSDGGDKLIAKVGDASLTATKDDIVLAKGDVTITLKDGEVTVKSEKAILDTASLHLGGEGGKEVARKGDRVIIHSGSSAGITGEIYEGSETVSAVD